MNLFRLFHFLAFVDYMQHNNNFCFRFYFLLFCQVYYFTSFNFTSDWNTNSSFVFFSSLFNLVCQDYQFASFFSPLFFLFRCNTIPALIRLSRDFVKIVLRFVKSSFVYFKLLDHSLSSMRPAVQFVKISLRLVSLFRSVSLLIHMQRSGGESAWRRLNHDYTTTLLWVFESLESSVWVRKSSRWVTGDVSSLTQGKKVAV